MPANKLIHENSPYLLQHAQNPVNWYPWSEEALQRAKSENKPILVSIGYAACHWCHVMERESFEDEATATLMNEHFINIKIDREERPDLDHIYMDAVQAMTGSGGWPLNVFLTPEAKPFYGGTYFPPQRAFNRPSWKEVLENVIRAFRERRHEIDAQAENLTEHLLRANDFGSGGAGETNPFSAEKTAEICRNLLKNADAAWGGFGKAPKFPQTFSIQYLLRYHAVSGNEAALQQALISLDKMIEGGIYDQLGGGFARYSTDNEWLAPHFEKMLYDNALLLSVISEAYALTRKPRYREVIGETMTFLQREMMNDQQGFYTAIDADSEGAEGKFYVWSLPEVTSLLGEDADIFCAYYDITEKGNWEGVNILRVKKPMDVFAEERHLEPQALKKILDAGREKLMSRREQRKRPQLDDKIILGWNALMNAACSKAFAATGEETYRSLAIANMQFLLDNFYDEQRRLFHHTWKNGQAKYPAFLDDLACLADALLQLQEITGDTFWLEKAKSVTEAVLAQFGEKKELDSGDIENPGGLFFYTPDSQRDVIIRKKEIYDGAVPSGNSVMAYNLYRLGILLDRIDWKRYGTNMTASLAQLICRYPGSFGNWAALFLEISSGTFEIAVTGENPAMLHLQVLAEYIPHRVLMTAREEHPGYPLLAGKQISPRASVFLCSNYTCQAPVFSANELRGLIDRVKKQ